jgi:hypothetical protein
MRTIFRTLTFLSFCILFFGCHKDDTPPPPKPPVANAGNDQTIQLPASSFTLAGSGTTESGTITSYTWTIVSGPNVPTINNATSATTTVSGFIAGTYIFQLQVTNSSGLSATDAATIIVNSAPATVPVANAGSDQTVQLPASTFVLSGSGTTQNGTITGYLWTRISGPNVPAINNASSATTFVSGFIAGTYSFQLHVTNSSGLFANDTVVINVIGIQTITLQPTNNPNEVHFAILGSTPGSDPNAPELVAAAWTVGGIPFYVRGAFKFDLSSIPSNATILSAKLTLYSNPTPINGNHVDANYGSNNSMFISRITANWSAATLDWNNQPPVSTTDQISIPQTSQPFLDLVDIDVKTMIASMVSTNNYGFMIQLQNEIIYDSRIFCSSKYTDATKHPKLVVTYQ